MASSDDTPTARLHLRRELGAHLESLGYTFVRRMHRTGEPLAEIARVNPVRGRLVYGETVLRADLRRRRCHERLQYFAHRRTRRRGQIPLFIAVEESCVNDLEALLVDLGIRGAVRGGNVYVLPVSATPQRKRPAPRAAR
jgi:hypothetical protein